MKPVSLSFLTLITNFKTHLQVRSILNFCVKVHMRSPLTGGLCFVHHQQYNKILIIKAVSQSFVLVYKMWSSLNELPAATDRK